MYSRTRFTYRVKNRAFRVRVRVKNRDKDRVKDRVRVVFFV